MKKNINDKLLSKNAKNEKIQLWSGTCNIGDTVTLSESVKNFRMLYVQPAGNNGYVMLPVASNFNQLRGLGAYTASASFEIRSINATCATTSFTLDRVVALSISTSGTTAVSSGNSLTTIWGVR